MIGKTISHYKILEKLGEGGMGVVYKAQDTKLDRFVALKFLPPQMGGDDEEKQRFIQEAKAASALDHNNICVIHEIGETDSADSEGQLFISMAYYEGQTLDAVLGPTASRAPLSLEDALDYASQISEGLSKAHEKDIVHRDLKPGNVMITNDGVVKILDFGLAKLGGHSKLTQAGTTLGTTAYMSPEQARGEDVDRRTDIFSLGVLLYEMLTGKRPFQGDYEQAVIYSIMNEDPEPITGLRSGIPMELEGMVNKCLRKEPSARYQHVDDLLVDLKAAQETHKSSVSKFQPQTPQKVSSVRKVAVPAVLSLVAIVALVGYFFFGKEPQVTERVPIAVVDFVNETNEPELSGLSGMLITALEQSRRLSVLTRSRMFDVLKQMGKEDVDHIDEALGRKICEQANVNAMAIATIRKFGKLYTIDLKVFDPHKNEHLFTANDEGEGQESIPAMIGKLSERTRRGLKEQAAEIQAANQKVAEVTTVNLQAYQHYFKGNELINKLKFIEAIEELTKAVALDTTFALAYYRLAYAENWEHPEGAKEPIRKVMQYLDEVPEKERYLIRALNADVEGNLNESIALYQESLKFYPEEKEALYGIGDKSFHIGDFATSISHLESVLAIDPTFERAWQHIIWTSREIWQYDKMLEYAKQYVAKIPTSEDAYDLLGDAYTFSADFDHALQTYKRAVELFPKSTMPVRGIGVVHIFMNEYEKAEAEFEKLLHESRASSDQRDGYKYLGWLYPHLGKYREAIKTIDKRIAIDLSLGDKTDLAGSYAEKTLWFLVGWNDVENAKEALGKGLELREAGDVFFYNHLFLSYLLMGEFQKASAVAKSQVSRYTPFQDFVVAGYIHRAKGQYDEAIKDFQRVTQRAYVPDKVFQGYNLAKCYLETGQHEKAIESVRRLQNISCFFVPTMFIYRAAIYPRGYYLLGQIYEKKGDTQQAVENTEKFLDLWKDADPDLPDLIDAKARLARLKESTKK